jgi:hypothetical protein
MNLFRNKRVRAGLSWPSLGRSVRDIKNHKSEQLYKKRAHKRY